MIPSGETFQVKNILDAGPWASGQIPKDWSVKVNRFWIDYTPSGDIDQFYSDLSVIDNASKAELDRQTHSCEQTAQVSRRLLLSNRLDYFRRKNSTQ